MSLASSPLLKPFYPALDGLRAVAFLLVFFVHYGPVVWSWKALRWGWVGVDLFFVISGFLITGILFDTLHRPDFFRNFYVRRTLRIFPVYYAFWIALLLATPILHIVWNRYVLAQAAYFGNFFYAGANLHLHADPGLLPFISFHHPGEIRFVSLGQLWSLAMEEQFYLVWPAVVFLIRSRKVLLRLCLFVIAALPFLRFVYFYNAPGAVAAGALYYNSAFRFDSLLFGAAIALWLRGPVVQTSSTIRRFALVAAVLCPTLLAIAYAFEPVHPVLTNFDPVVSTIGYTLVDITVAAVLLLALDSHNRRLVSALQFRPLAALGRISYGLYLFHTLPFEYLQGKSPDFFRHHVGFLIPVLGFAFSLAVAFLSFRYLESPFLRLKDRLSPRPGVSDPQPATLIGMPRPIPQPSHANPVQAA